MGSKYNYRWYRSRLKLEDKNRLPSGNWATVKLAAELLGVSKDTVRWRYLKGKLPVIRYKNRIYVKLS